MNLSLHVLPFLREKRGEARQWLSPGPGLLVQHSFSSPSLRSYWRGVKRAHASTPTKRKPAKESLSGRRRPLPAQCLQQPSPRQHRLHVTTMIGRLNSWSGAGLLAPSRQGGQGAFKDQPRLLSPTSAPAAFSHFLQTPSQGMMVNVKSGSKS